MGDKFFANFDSIQNEDWDYGVFYPYDANSVDKRCRWLEDYKGYDCPGGWISQSGKWSADASKLGAGGYPAGNPERDPQGGAGSSGGGAGCHFEPTKEAIDQTDAINYFKANLVADYHCRCNAAAFGRNWDQWVQNWLENAQFKKGFDYQAWFAKGKAPSWGGDIASCWMNNPRDMIKLQNALYWRRADWNNQKAPKSAWQGNGDPTSNRPYWGWNEVPVDRALMNSPENWDAIIIKLPASSCGKIASNDDSVACLSHGAQLQLEQDLEKFLNAGFLALGVDKYSAKPGSSVAFVRETMDFNGNYQKEFFCQPWTSPSNKYDIVFVSDKGPGKDGSGACYIQAHAGSAIYI